jgi:hypothetical protein
MEHLINEISPLKVERWEAAHTLACEQIRTDAPEPLFEHYVRGMVSKYPPIVIKGLVAALLVLALGALFVSAGKQMIATDFVLSDLVQYGRVGSTWVDMSLLVTLLLGEIGALTFGLGAAIFSGRVGKVIFRTAAIGSASLAVFSNITVTAIHPIPQAIVYQVLLTIGPPILVLAIGYFFERLLLSTLEARGTARQEWQTDHDAWEMVQRAPKTHPDYKLIFQRQIINQLRIGQTPERRKNLELYLMNVPDASKILILREYARHEMALGFDVPNPTLPEGKNSLTPLIASQTYSNETDDPSLSQS